MVVCSVVCVGDVNVITSYYYCYYAVVVIMLCVLEYAVLKVSNRASAVRRISRVCENSFMLSSVAKPDG